VADTVARLVETLGATAAELKCEPYLKHCIMMAENPSAAQSQLDLLAETGEAKEMVRQLVEGSRVSGSAAKA
jgi:gamma-glutamyl:cysteine ligase YbdK (ATP-grasp superfamily)